ncbi:MAG: M14 family zinc carboxypeptidase [Bryobacterales bacterium]|nr:M14 family zinc carboxypeptidase [Bryobacteraceae bacterium]MDW8353421.1 M14 family zinc carboxypeptidase [Bryobacterales bacterium]
MRNAIALSLGLALTTAAGAQSRFEFWPGAVYDPAIPTFEKVLGYAPGERISWHAALLEYLEALAAAAPDRVRLFDYARSWEGRRLVYAVVGSPANLRRLDEIRAGMARLADPRKTPEPEARKLIHALPALVWLAYGVHGNEISSPEAALLTTYHLLAARNDKLVSEILNQTLVFIDPCQNPDGRDRFVHHFEQAVGLEPDASPLAAEHNENWPGGRTNHYHFDLNRDWFALTQPETRGRIRALREWYPLVFVDLHEMGSETTYYFAPEAVPYNPHLTRQQREILEWFGRNNARWFDRFGFLYFTREIFDAFFPGYGASWPSYHGAIAMTYEQASTRGLLIRRSDDTVLHFRDAIRRHFVASISTAETAARNREKLLEEFYRYRRSAIEEGAREFPREYLLPRRGDVSAVDKLATLLVEQGVEVRRATAPFRNAGAEYPAGSYVISLAQPTKRLIRTLLDPHVPMDEAFIKEQERRRKKRLPDEVYDVTAWSLPAMFNVEAVAASETSSGNFEPFTAPPRGRIADGEGGVAYLVPWGTLAAGRVLTAALRQGLRVRSTDRPFAQGGRKYPSGTLIFLVAENPPDLSARLEKIAAAAGAEIYPTDTGWVDEGVNFGSSRVVYVPKPSVALAWDTPTSAYSAGWARFVLERQYDYPVTPIRTRQLASADLRKFDVLILPGQGPGSYASVLGPEAPRRLKEWVSAGGTLIGIAGAVSYLADPRVGLLAVSQENRPRPTPEAKPEPGRPTGEAERRTGETAEGRVPGRLLATEEDYERAIQPDSELPDQALGVLVRARTDPDHWLAAGAPATVNALLDSRAIFAPIKLDKGVNVAFFEAPDRLLVSGYLWEETRKQLAYKPLVIAQPEGRGVVIAFTADPNYRAYLDGMNVLFLNAVFRGPAHARPLPTH